MVALIKEAVAYRDLILQLTLKNIRARYQQSLLGWSWAVVLPAAQAVILSIVFTYFVPVDTDGIPYVVFCYVAMIPWAFLAASLTDMSNSLVENMSLVTKIYFPRHIVPIASMLARLADFVVASAVGAVLLIVFHGDMSAQALLYLPLIFVVQIILILGIGLACAAANVFFRDVRSILVLCLQLWLYASPVIYSVQSVPEHLRGFYALNPMVGVIEAYRNVLLRGAPPTESLLTSAAFGLVACWLSIWIFRKVEWRFADVV